MRHLTCLLATLAIAAMVGCGGGGYVEEEAVDTTPALTVTPTVTDTPATPTVISAGDVISGKATIKQFVKQLPGNPAGSDDGLEKYREWSVLDWANSATVSTWKRNENSDDVLLVIEPQGGAKDKVAIVRKAQMSLASNGMLTMDVYNATPRKIGMAFAVIATVDDVYSESTAKTLSPGWNRLVWNLGSPTYKTEASGWLNKVKLYGHGEVKQLILLVYDSKKSVVAIDQLKVDTATN